MPLPLLLIPLAVAGGSALVQTVSKLRTHSRLNGLQGQLQQLESQHRDQMQQHYDRQTELCLLLDLLEPELPTALREPEPAEATETPVPRWRRLLKRQKRTLADGSPHTRSGIIGRHAGSFAAGTVWRTVSAPVMNVVQPVAARILTFAPRLAATGAASSSIVASTALRFALSAVSVVGLVLGPALAALSIFREVQKVRKARRELDATRIQLQEELAQYAAQTHQLEQQAATMPTPETAIQTPVAIG
jgi:hypothetical protein